MTAERRAPRALDYPVAPASLPDTTVEAGRYRVRFARTSEDLDRILQLRFTVFNLELGEGLDLAYVTGRDEDDFDARFHHLMIESRDGGEVVGTYRMQTAAMAQAHGGFYSADEFDLSGVPADVLSRSVELGRACVAREHRNGRVLNLLWRGLAAYLIWNRHTCLFGCCSLTSQDPRLGRAVMTRLEQEGRVDPRVRVVPLPHTTCDGADDAGPAPDPHIPALFQSYLNLGATVWGPPAIDRLFKTIDFIVGLDVTTVDPSVVRTFFR
ncbi:MAG TPA: GNAT family N-acyltransferase [Gemmatimonadales bacterium]|nr:GNAT family N-acyltransferase [Gemmatimonadales bacterium]